MFLLVWILVLKHTDWDIRPAESGIYEKRTFSGRDLTPVATPPYVSFLPSATHWCCMSVWHVWENVTGSRPRRRKTFTPVFTRIEFPFSKSNMGFFLCFCSNSINFSFSLFTIVPWSFVPRGCYWPLWSTKREERWLVATASYLNFELLSPWIAFFECFVFSGRMHSIKL